jgi:MFS family permease
MMTSQPSALKSILCLPVIVAALGDFVDIYDLLLFGIVRVPSLIDMGLDPDIAGTYILKWQMIGLLIGGLLWGILGDKRGRLSVLFGSILVYSLANIACGALPHLNFMDKTELYAILRFIAGIGLAGELGAGITLVSESLPKQHRALGTSVVAGFGLLGAVVAQLTVQLTADWSLAYYIGGFLGLALLLLRVGVVESGVFKNIEKQADVARGQFWLLLARKTLFIKYIKSVAIGIPTWFCIGILAVMANQFAPALGITKLDPGKAIMWAYIGISLGDFASGFISHALHSRKKAILYMMLFTIVGVVLMLYGPNQSEKSYYFFCLWLGLGTGYWAMFVTVASEQFGTNLRSTATTTVPNVVRGLLPVLLFAFDGFKVSMGVIHAAAIVGTISFAVAIWATLTIEETHNKDLDFVE